MSLSSAFEATFPDYFAGHDEDFLEIDLMADSLCLEMAEIILSLDRSLPPVPALPLPVTPPPPPSPVAFHLPGFQPPIIDNDLPGEVIDLTDAPEEEEREFIYIDIPNNNARRRRRDSLDLAQRRRQRRRRSAPASPNLSLLPYFQSQSEDEESEEDRRNDPSYRPRRPALYVDTGVGREEEIPVVPANFDDTGIVHSFDVPSGERPVSPVYSAVSPHYSPCTPNSFFDDGEGSPTTPFSYPDEEDRRGYSSEALRERHHARYMRHMIPYLRRIELTDSRPLPLPAMLSACDTAEEEGLYAGERTEIRVPRDAVVLVIREDGYTVYRV